MNKTITEMEKEAYARLAQSLRANVDMHLDEMKHGRTKRAAVAPVRPAPSTYRPPAQYTTHASSISADVVQTVAVVAAIKYVQDSSSSSSGSSDSYDSGSSSYDSGGDWD